MKDRIELEKRLNAIKEKTKFYMPVFGMYCYDFYEAFYTLCPIYRHKVINIYHEHIKEYNDHTEITVPHLLDCAMNMPMEERNKMLYNVLVLPFYYYEKERRESK